MKVLVIENEEFFAENMCRYLQQNTKVEIQHISHAEDALNLISQYSYDLIISDLCLPDAPKPDWLLKIGDLRPGQKIVVISSYEIPEAIRTSKKMQLLAYFEKPFDIEKVTNLILILK